jgi:Helix-turn-helix domain
VSIDTDIRWLKPAEAAEYGRISINVLSRAAQRGDLASSKIGKTRLYLREDIDAWISLHRCGGDA